MLRQYTSAGNVVTWNGCKTPSREQGVQVTFRSCVAVDGLAAACASIDVGVAAVATGDGFASGGSTTNGEATPTGEAGAEATAAGALEER
jgi:hypothetical protein